MLLFKARKCRKSASIGLHLLVLLASKYVLHRLLLLLLLEDAFGAPVRVRELLCGRLLSSFLAESLLGLSWLRPERARVLLLGVEESGEVILRLHVYDLGVFFARAEEVLVLTH